MARIAGVNIPTNKRVTISLRYIYGIGPAKAQEICTTGAKVLHPRAIKPCRDAGVPIWILDTSRPDLPGSTT